MHVDMTSYVASMVCYCQSSSYTYVHMHVSLLTLCEVIAKKYCILYYTPLGIMQGSIVECCMPITIIFYFYMYMYVYVVSTVCLQVHVYYYRGIVYAVKEMCFSLP